MVKDLTGFGFIQADISSYLDISDETLRKYYRTEINHGALQMNTAVMRNMFEKACSPNPQNNAVGIF